MERCYFKCFVCIGLLLFLAVAVLPAFLPIMTPPSALKRALSRVRVGMTQDEATGEFETCRSEIDSRHYSGVTRDGRPFMKYDLAQIPPPSEIEEYELYLMDNDGNEAEIFFEPGGTVTHKRYTSSYGLGEWLLIRTRELPALARQQLRACRRLAK